MSSAPLIAFICLFPFFSPNFPKSSRKKKALEVAARKAAALKKERGDADEEDDKQIVIEVPSSDEDEGKLHGTLYIIKFLIIFLYDHIAAAAKPEKLTIAERWEKLLNETKAKVEEEHAMEEATPPRIKPIQRQLYREMQEFDSEIVWTINHIVWAFNLPTSYVLPGQEATEFEDAIIRVPLDPKRVDLIPTYSQVQLEDVVDGWIKYLLRTMKALKDQPLDEFTPMAEYRYWHKMEIDLYGTLEQLKTVFVVTVLARLREMKAKILSEWDKTVRLTEEKFQLAKENSDYLSTIIEYLEVSIVPRFTAYLI